MFAKIGKRTHRTYVHCFHGKKLKNSLALSLCVYGFPPLNVDVETSKTLK